MNLSIIILFLLVLITFILLWRLFFYSAPHKGTAAPSPEGKRGDPGRCPLCNSALVGGEQIKSTVYSGGDEQDRVCHISGCPHCLPSGKKAADRMNPSCERLCPVCGQKVPIEGYLRARLFLRKNGSRHVHITGCSECYKVRHTKR